MRLSKRMMAVAALGVCAGAMAAGAQQLEPKWSYDGKTGPFNWSKLDPAYKACNSGKDQAPIDIRGAHLDKALQPVEFHYPSGAMTLTNTGRTVQVTPPAGSYIVVG